MNKSLEFGLGSGNVPSLPEDFYSKLAENTNAGPITRAFAALADCQCKFTNITIRAEKATRQLERKAKEAEK